MSVTKRMFVRYRRSARREGTVPEATIEVPAEHVEAIRESLIGRLGDVGHAEEVHSLLGQIGDDSPGIARTRTLTGSRVILWSAVYDALCAAAEQLADDCNEYWRGAIDPDQARGGIASVAVRLELLVALGSSPGP
jgi:hypothetical protein